MRALWVTTGACLAMSLVLLAVLIFHSGEVNLPSRGTGYVHGYAAYAMGAAYLALSPAAVTAFLLGVDIGPKYWLRFVRNVSFFCFALALAVAAVLGVAQVYGNVAL